MKTLFAFLLLSPSFALAVTMKMAITVDDHPAHGPLPPGMTRLQVAQDMLKVFKKHGVPEASAFANTGKTEELRPVLQAWRDAGYPLGNHTLHHPGLNDVSVEEFTRQIDDNEPLLKELNGKTEFKFFRYPFLREGDTLEKRNAVRAHLAKRGYRIAQVTVDFEDWAWNTPYVRCLAKKDEKAIRWLEETYLQNAVDMVDRARTAADALFGRPVGHVLLLHVGAFDARMLDRLLTAYAKKGVEFVTLEEAQKDEIYSQDPGLAAKWGSELTFQFMKARGKKLKDLGLKPYSGYPENRLKSICGGKSSSFSVGLHASENHFQIN